MSNDDLFSQYAERLKAIDELNSTYKENKEKRSWYFQSSLPKSLEVELFIWKQGASFLGINVKGVDCAYWHTAEEESLDYHMELAEAALLGNVEFNISPILRRKEVCFKIGDKWECTLTDKANIFHYMKTRKKLNSVK